MRRIRRLLFTLASSALAAFSVAFAQPAFAAGAASVTVGPVSTPGPVPVTACVATTCVSTPPLSSMSLTATSSTDNVLAVPILTPGLCPGGTMGATVTATSASTASQTISATVTGTLPNGQALSESVGPTTVTTGPGRSATVSACTS